MKKQRLYAAVILILVLISAVPKLFLAPRFADGLRHYLQRELAAEAVEVRLRSPWGFELLSGRIPGLEVVVKQAVIENLAVEEITIKGEEIRFDPRTLLKEKEFLYQGAKSLETELKVKEKALNEFFWEEVDPDKALRLTVQPQGVSLQGAINFFNMALELKMDGDLEIWQDTVLRFVPAGLTIKDASLPAFVLEMLNENYGIGLDLGVFPYPIVISDVNLLAGEMVVRIGVVE
ncbi:MAG TPA: DUF2993 domain-containing protein [Firmicutes bacterium]|nr:DUF2993 domain-containing protein [Bacillota bacterium]